MPNYVQNIIQFSDKTPVKSLKKLFESVLVIRDANGKEMPYAVEHLTKDQQVDFDFERLRPMPKDLDVERSSKSTDAEIMHALYEGMPALIISQIFAAKTQPDKLFSGLTCEEIDREADIILKFIGTNTLFAPSVMKEIKGEVNLLIKDGEWHPGDSGINDMLTRIDNFIYDGVGYHVPKVMDMLRIQDKMSPSVAGLIEKFEENDIQELVQIGRIRYENTQKYGAADWYDWRCSNWGTKWNAFDTIVDWNARTISFHTAWSCPTPIIKILSEWYPDVEFTWIFADEDCGSNSGQYTFSDGSLREDLADDNSPEALALYVECWGASPCMYQNENLDWCRYDCKSCPHPC